MNSPTVTTGRPANGGVDIETLLRAVLVEEEAAFEDFNQTVRQPDEEQLRSGKLLGPFVLEGHCAINPLTKDLGPAVPRPDSTWHVPPGFKLCTSIRPVLGYVDLGKVKEDSTVQVTLAAARGKSSRAWAKTKNATLVHYDLNRAYLQFPKGASSLPEEPFYLRETLADYGARYKKGIKLLPPGWMAPREIQPPAEPDAWSERATAGMDESTRQAFHWACSNNDVVGIKGPPGTGKTRLLGVVAAALMARALRVGILAQSHAVVNNALNSCLEESRRLGLTKRIGKKNDKRALLHPDVEVWAPGTAAPDCWGATLASAAGFCDTKVRKPRRYADLAGCPVHEDYRRDVLLVDEAGQLLAYQLASCAFLSEKIVLFGDEAQLPPITVGNHTDEAQVATSALAFLAAQRGPEWVKPLLVSHRLNTGLCTVIRENFYPELALQPGLNAATRLENVPAVSLLPVKHQFKTVKSQEEIDAVEALIARLLGQPLHLPHGTVPLAPEHIMVLAPYRCQVRALVDRLRRFGLADRVGTVDRMQGQGAPVIIYSMTSSAPDYVGGQADWCFSPNRWNVIISRAMAACIIVASDTVTDLCAPATLAGVLCRERVSRLLRALPRYPVPPSPL